MTLKYGDTKAISEMFELLSKGIDSLIDNVIELCYFMRGAIPYEQMLRRTPGELQRIGNFITKRIEQESKKQFPNY